MNEDTLSVGASPAISEAVILMAGSGSRLRGSGEPVLKPLIPVLGRPLVCYTMDALAHAGIKKITFIVGFERNRLRAAVENLAPAGIEIRFIENPDWQKQNGISLLAAANHLAEPFLLTMCDHLFDDAIVDLLIESADLTCLNLAIDKKIDSVFDLDDAMKILTRDDRVIAIGKDLRNYNAIDIGLFVCPLEIFGFLEQAKQNDDCSLADGVRLMAADGKVHAVNIGEAWWQDVDTPEMLAHATEVMRR
ncbi:MAG: 1L-myo-inositol 1-phosphate cytidylyltransferase [Verrucomicrobiota bacterium]|jgi:choline kinase